MTCQSKHRLTKFSQKHHFFYRNESPLKARTSNLALPMGALSGGLIPSGRVVYWTPRQDDPGRCLFSTDQSTLTHDLRCVRHLGDLAGGLRLDGEHRGPVTRRGGCSDLPGGR